MTRPTDLLVILTSAVLTVLLVAPILTPPRSHAEGESDAKVVITQIGNLFAAFIPPPTGQPTPLAADGVELTLKRDQELYNAGETPVLTLVAVNKSDKKCKTKATVKMSSMAPRSPMSRSMPMPVAVFTKEIEIELLAGQTLEIPLETGYAVPTNIVVSMVISVGELHQPAGSFALAAPAPAVQSQAVAAK